MKKPSYRIIESCPDVEYYIYSASITKSSLDLADEVFEKFHILISPQTINNYRNKMPRNKIKKLREGRKENISSLQFVLDILKEQLKNVEDPTLKLKYSEEILQIVKEIELFTEQEIEYLKTF